MKRTLSLAFTAALGVLLLSLSCSNDNGCEAALNQTRMATQQVCGEDAYSKSAFCTTCVTAGYFSTSGPTDCTCRLLAFDQSNCTYPGDQEAKAAVRGAIAWANNNCASFSFQADGGPKEAETGAGENADGSGE